MNKKIILTNGCCDILHVGHIHLLKEAKKLGDVLIVAINTDQSIKLIKGEDRPINNLKNRVQMLQSIDCVDWVIPFNETTPLNIIKAIEPNILVKGGDYKQNDIVGSDFVKKKGGLVKIIKFLDGFSSSKIINQIKGI